MPLETRTAVMEAAEKHWTRAKDVEKLTKAVIEKLTKQCIYVL
jgi:hypothetical protein